MSFEKFRKFLIHQALKFWILDWAELSAWSDQPNFLYQIKSLDPNSLLTHSTLFSFAQIEKFQCPTNGEFPEVFKTQPTFVCRSIFKAPRSLQNKGASFIERGCTYMNNVIYKFIPSLVKIECLITIIIINYLILSYTLIKC